MSFVAFGPTAGRRGILAGWQVFIANCKRDYSITGIENSPPSLIPDGQRAVTVLVRV